MTLGSRETLGGSLRIFRLSQPMNLSPTRYDPHCLSLNTNKKILIGITQSNHADIGIIGTGGVSCFQCLNDMHICMVLWRKTLRYLRLWEPYSDRLLIFLYKDVKDTYKNVHAKSSFPLEGFFGLESGFSYDKEEIVMAIVCQKSVVLFAFENREGLIQFEIKIRRSLGEEHQLPVRISKVPLTSKLPQDTMVKMHIHGQKFCITAYVPPKLLMSWQIPELRRFGLINDKFCFEGGSRCGKGAGFHVFSSQHSVEIDEIFELASQGKTPSCKKNATKRRSQISDYLEPRECSYSDRSFKDFHNTQVCADQNFRSDDPDWPKRHSISVTDYRRTGSYPDKVKLVSIENLERQRLMANYDYPPRIIRRVDNIYADIDEDVNDINDNIVTTRSHALYSNIPDQITNSSASVVSCQPRVAESEMNNQLSYDNKRQSLSYSAPILNNGIPDPNSNSHVGGAGVDIYESERINEEIDKVTTRTRRQEARDKLQMQEMDLQRELFLLDAILKDCQVEEQGNRNSTRIRPEPLSFNHKSASFPDNTTAAHWLDTVGKRTATGYSDSALLSPNLLSRLKKIPTDCKLSKPLPYVNLAKYDGVECVTHVHHSARSTPEVNSAPSLTSNYDNINTDGTFVNGSLDCTSVTAQYSDKENNPSLQINHSIVKSVSSSSLVESQNKSATCTDNSNVKTECIYMNDKQQSPPPPELPPKGPGLLNRNRLRTSNLMSSTSSLPGHYPPPLPRKSPDVRHRRNSNLYKYHNCNFSSSPVLPPKSTTATRDESYLLMNSFSKESTKETPSPMGTTKVDKRGDTFYLQRPVEYPNSYMEMAGKFMSETEVCCPDESVKMIPCTSSSPASHHRYSRSMSDSTTLAADRPRPVLSHSNSVDSGDPPPGVLIRESNYMEMTGFSNSRKSVLQNLHALHSYVSSTTAGERMSPSFPQEEGNTKKVMPFPNLLNFSSKTFSSSKLEKASSEDPVYSLPSEKEQTPKENSNKQGFFTRIMRRNSNSKERKASIQSQESLLDDSTVSEQFDTSSVKDDLKRIENSPSASLHALNHQDHSSPIHERHRSSSFPSRSSFVEMITKTAPPQYKMKDKKSASTDDILSPSDCDESTTRKSEDIYQVLTAPTKVMLEKPSDNDSISDKLNNSAISETNVFTVLHVQDSSHVSLSSLESSKTDDEKLYDLLLQRQGSNEVSDLKKECDISPQLTAEEQAAAIAKHVHSLPPFIPPKSKPLPKLLSPVLEGMSPSPSSDSLGNKQTDTDQIGSPPDELKQSSPSVQKQFAKANLRISAPVPEEPDAVWIPRSSVSTESSPMIVRAVSPSINETAEEVAIPEKVFIREKSSVSDSIDDLEPQVKEAQANPLIVEVDDYHEPVDTVSLSSRESSDAISIRSEEAIRSSPASTILRPRSGKEYQVIERRRTIDESHTSSPITPLSPHQSDSVFSFDGEPSSPSSINKYSADGESPLINKILKSIDKTFSTEPEYMNVNATPPASPHSRSDTPADVPAIRLLNYADIDLSDPVKKKSETPVTKSRKPKNSPIEYALIDLEATEAAQKAGKEHAQARTDTLLRNERKELLRSESMHQPEKTNNLQKDTGKKILRSESCRVERNVSVSEDSSSITGKDNLDLKKESLRKLGSKEAHRSESLRQTDKASNLSKVRRKDVLRSDSCIADKSDDSVLLNEMRSKRAVSETRDVPFDDTRSKRAMSETRDVKYSTHSADLV